MKRVSYFLLFVAVLWIATTDFSGCSGGFSFNTHAKNAGDSGAFKNEPDVTFKDLNGESVSLASLRGKVVLVNFWATYCEPCQVEIPWLIDFEKKFAAQGFTVLGVAMDDEGKSIVAPFVEKSQFDVDGAETRMNYPIVLGNDDIGDKFGGLFGFPTSFLISRDGKIHKKIIGLTSYDELEQLIQSQL